MKNKKSDETTLEVIDNTLVVHNINLHFCPLSFKAPRLEFIDDTGVFATELEIAKGLMNQDENTLMYPSSLDERAAEILDKINDNYHSKREILQDYLITDFVPKVAKIVFNEPVKVDHSLYSSEELEEIDIYHPEHFNGERLSFIQDMFPYFEIEKIAEYADYITKTLVRGEELNPECVYLAKTAKEDFPTLESLEKNILTYDTLVNVNITPVGINTASWGNIAFIYVNHPNQEIKEKALGIIEYLKRTKLSRTSHKSDEPRFNFHVTQ